MSPVIIFAYKRLDTLKRTVEALKNDALALKTELYIYSDCAKTQRDEALVNSVRNYIKNINGFKNVSIQLAEKNRGLANSIISGVSEVISKSDSVIVLEDDLVVSPNFLTYMNQALDFYKGQKEVFSIAGHNLPVTLPHNYDYDTFFTRRSSSWGWATWKDRWEEIDWSCKSYPEFKNNKMDRAAFAAIGSDMNKMLDRQMNGELDSWAIRWCFHQFISNTFSVHPVLSKVENIGFNNEATNTNNYNRYQTELDTGEKYIFNFPKEISSKTDLTYLYSDFYSVKNRIIGKLLTYIMRLGLIKKQS